MNPEAQAVLDEILRKDPEALTLEERLFLRARRSYLKKSQLEEYKDILNEVEEPAKKRDGAIASYNELYTRARNLGYEGKRISRPKLEAFIKEKDAFAL